MRWHIATLFIILSTSLSAQKKVSEVCADYRHHMDSLMRLTYGDTLFEKYFVFDTNSYVWVDHHTMHSWNETFTGDSITAVEFWYVFVFPGAQISPVDGYRPGSTIMWVFEDSLKYSARCISVDSGSVARITKEKLKKPLNACYVTLYTHDFFMTDNTPEQSYDSTHVYIKVKYVKYKGSGRRGTKFKSWHHSILIDACTGEYIGREDDKYEGVVGGHF